MSICGKRILNVACDLGWELRNLVLKEFGSIWLYKNNTRKVIY